MTKLIIFGILFFVIILMIGLGAVESIDTDNDPF